MMDQRFTRAYDIRSSVQRTRGWSGVLAGVAAIAIGIVSLFIVFWLAVFFAALGAILLTVAWIRSLMWRRALRPAGKRGDVIDIVVDEDSIRVEPYQGR